LHKGVSSLQEIFASLNSATAYTKASEKTVKGFVGVCATARAASHSQHEQQAWSASRHKQVSKILQASEQNFEKMSNECRALQASKRRTASNSEQSLVKI